jgi:hypothetical protein
MFKSRIVELRSWGAQDQEDRLLLEIDRKSTTKSITRSHKDQVAESERNSDLDVMMILAGWLTWKLEKAFVAIFRQRKHRHRRRRAGGMQGRYGRQDPRFLLHEISPK